MRQSDYGLNDEQWAAVNAPSPAIVHASAGAGKTRCLVAKISLILDAGGRPDSVCAVTFTNKAANEMKERLKARHNIAGMQISTIHSMCVRIIRTFPQHTPLKVPFSIYDDSDQLAVVKTVMKARKMDGDPWEILGAISRAKSDGNMDRLEPAEARVFEAYREILLANNACDFDDLLVYADACLKRPDCRGHFTKLWRHILVDEFQDTSSIQYGIILALYDPATTCTFFCVGDQNQSIYGWRSARPENMQDFIDRHKPSERHLTYNYRSASAVIGHANSFLQFGPRMEAKSTADGMVCASVFSSMEDEARLIAEAVEKLGNYQETAILYRVNSRSLLFERALAVRRVPYKVVGDLPFYKRRVVKDLLSYCKAAANTQDVESLARIVNVPKRGFGEARQERLLREGRAYFDQAAAELPEIGRLKATLDGARGRPPAEALGAILSETGYRASVDKEADIGLIETLLNVAHGFSSLDELILSSTFLEEDSGRGVKLMTAHASKGLEFDRVFVVGVEDGVWPHRMSADTAEEERLYYVACTRARKYLNISYSRTKMSRGAQIPTGPSNFFVRSRDLLRA